MTCSGGAWCAECWGWVHTGFCYSSVGQALNQLALFQQDEEEEKEEGDRTEDKVDDQGAEEDTGGGPHDAVTETITNSDKLLLAGSTETSLSEPIAFGDPTVSSTRSDGGWGRRTNPNSDARMGKANRPTSPKKLLVSIAILFTFIAVARDSSLGLFVHLGKRGNIPLRDGGEVRG